jgi:hypothetical protein
MSSGVSRVMAGSVNGTGADLDVRTVGFRPRKVELFNEDGLVKAEWTETMADGLAMKAVTAGTISMTGAGTGVTPLSDGFRIGADADLNAADEKIHWVAYE